MKKNKMQLSQLKVESFITEMDGVDKETVNGGSTPGIYLSVTVVVSIGTEIHEIGDNRSWWHCDNGGGGAGSEVVVPVDGGEACQLSEVVING